MAYDYQKAPWRDLLPDVYGWLSTASIKTASSAPSDGVLVCLSAVSEEKDAPVKAGNSALPQASQNAISQALQASGWKGSGSILITADNLPVLVVAPTKLKTTKPQKSRAFGLEAARALKGLSFKKVSFALPDDLCFMEATTGFATGLYQTKGFKAPSNDAKATAHFPTEVVLVGCTSKDEDIERVKHSLRCSTIARHLQDAPPNYLNPVRFADIAQDMCKEFGISCKVYGREDLEKWGMGSFLSVNNGSATPARMIVMEVEGTAKGKTVALCGKGLTFDSGGLSIKPSSGMEEMKYDMSGGSAVLGAMLFLGKYRPKNKVVGIIGATENLVSANATRPSDIVTAMNGKTIEVLNTDAEGRLVLADLLCYAISEHKADCIFDIATLTGAVLVALGTVGSAVLSNDSNVARLVLDSSASVGEPFWELPLWPELENETKGTYGDLANIAKSSVRAGTIMGAMFLQEFVGKTKWAHLDIAGTGWDCKATGFPSGGASAFGMRTLVAVAERFEG